ncbi:hypothetical protein BGZ46_009862 [Entomortierella lignicola]|nr:hypothetical protein BGZ46_009862 [Entomortierella lignicola]
MVPITSSFTKYSRCIRQLPAVGELFNYFQYLLQNPDDRVQQLINSQHMQPRVEAMGLMRHFLIRCSNLDVNTKLLVPWDLKIILNQCSIKLRKLTLNCNLFETCEEINQQESSQQEMGRQKVEELATTFQLKELVLENYSDNNKLLDSFWSWFWCQCNSVERLDIRGPVGSIENLAKGMQEHMPNLCKALLRNGNRGGTYPTDKNIATIVSSCRNGWKEFKIGPNNRFFRESKLALVAHYPTLQVLAVPRTKYSSEELVQLLSTAPNLQTLSTIYEGLYEEQTDSYLEACMFINMDPASRLLRPWASEGSLKVFKVKIRDIPRPDLELDYIGDEYYPGEGRDIQSRVYERLARFTRLEVLWLGFSPGSYFERLVQYDCLDMSLESGLEKLAGLKELRELSISNMRTKLGLNEVKWMAENWPNLRVIRASSAIIGHNIGFLEGNETTEDRKAAEDSGEDDGCEEYESSQRDELQDFSNAITWLKEHCPRIQILY